MIDLSKYKKFMLGSTKSVIADMRSKNSLFANVALNNHIRQAKLSGIDVDGIVGNKKTYSQKKYTVWILQKYAINAGGFLASKYVKKMSWHEFRLAQGIRGDFVNVNYTGEFWRSFVVITRGNTAQIIYIGDEIKWNRLNNLFGEFYVLHEQDLRRIFEEQMSIEFSKSCIKHCKT